MCMVLARGMPIPESVVVFNRESEAVLWGGGGRVEGASLMGNCSFQFARFGADSHSLNVFIILVTILHMKI